MTHYNIGQTVNIEHKKQILKFYLLKFLGDYADKNRARVFRLKTPLPDGRSLVSYEVWQYLDLSTGAKDIRKFPVYLYEEIPDDFVDAGRKDTIDDNQEVTSLLDSYECWEEYCKTSPPVSKRDGKNFHLKIINSRHSQQISKLRELDSYAKFPTEFKTGVRYKLIQKETPNHYTRRDLNLWKQEFPDLFTKLSNYVYKNCSFDELIDSFKNSSS